MPVIADYVRAMHAAAASGDYGAINNRAGCDAYRVECAIDENGDAVSFEYLVQVGPREYRIFVDDCYWAAKLTPTYCASLDVANAVKADGVTPGELASARNPTAGWRGTPSNSSRFSFRSSHRTRSPRFPGTGRFERSPSFPESPEREFLKIRSGRLASEDYL